jgi:hypothetical protein
MPGVSTSGAVRMPGLSTSGAVRMPGMKASGAVRMPGVRFSSLSWRSSDCVYVCMCVCIIYIYIYIHTHTHIEGTCRMMSHHTFSDLTVSDKHIHTHHENDSDTSLAASYIQNNIYIYIHTYIHTYIQDLEVLSHTYTNMFYHMYTYMRNIPTQSPQRMFDHSPTVSVCVHV